MMDKDFLSGMIVGGVLTLLIATSLGRRFLLGLAGLTEKQIKMLGEKIVTKIEERARA